MIVKSVLSIAGSDSSGGAGIQADIKTISTLGLYAQTAITALTAQNTTGVFGIENVDPEFLAEQIDVVFGDICPDAVKIGMAPSPEAVSAIADSLRRNSARNIVLDPVMVATSGSSLSTDKSVETLVGVLMPLADVITPNIPEAEALSGIPITCEDDMVQAARVIQERIVGEYADLSESDAPAILIKGGHFIDESSDDFLLDGSGQEIWIHGKRIDNRNTHGTGCTLSSAIACGLAKGESIEEACRSAKRYLAEILEAGLENGFDLGSGSGPLMHFRPS